MSAGHSARLQPAGCSTATSWLQLSGERRRRRPGDKPPTCPRQPNDNSPASRNEAELARRLAAETNTTQAHTLTAAPRPPGVRHSRAPAARFLLVACSLFLTLGQLQTGARPAQSAVIRPTIFSDLPPEPPAPPQPATSQQAADAMPQPPAQPPPQPQQAQAQQQQQQQQQQLQNSIHPQAQHHLHHLHHLHHPHQSDGPQAQKINPLKSRFCHGLGGRADHALGLQSGAIDDLSLSASSYSNEQVRPHLARLNRDLLGGAWCPMKPVSSLGQEWIQVKLNRSYVISAIETQGRFALGSGKEFVPSYHIVYSRNNGLTWHKWKDFRGSTLLKANEDANTPVRNELSPPIVGANVIRVLPHSQYLRTVCLRLELFGCQYDEGAPVAYATANGVVEPRWGHLVDYTYDGLIQRSGQLSGGLGQLVDGVKGPDNFSYNNGFEWVGWKSANGDVVIEFAFKTLRNFTGALFHSNNLFSSGVEVFQAVDVHYGIDLGQSMEALRDALLERERRRPANRPADEWAAPPAAGPPHQQGGTVWSSDVLSIEYEPDKKAESSRPVTVHLKQRLANKLRFTLKFASKWILLSEVEFLSHPVELMSLASLNEQLTPRLMADLRQAKTYDQYVATLREHQLRRIAADEYLQMGGSSPTSPSAATSTSSSASSSTQSSQDPQPAANEQQSESQLVGGEFQPTSSPPPSSLYQDPMQAPAWAQEEAAAGLRQANQARLPVAWLASDGQPASSSGGPATNPMLANQPPSMFVPQLLDQQPNQNPNAIELDPQQQQQRSRTIGLATVISFVFVGVLGLMGLLFAASSYRLRGRSLGKLDAAHHLQRRLHNSAGSAGAVGALASGKGNFMSDVFAAANQNDSSAASSGDSSAGSLHTRSSQPAAASYRQHLTLNGHHQPAYPQQHQLQQADSLYNPLFASTSGRSSEGSLKKAPALSGGGPLSTLRKFTSALSSHAHHSSRHPGQGELPFARHHQQAPAHNQLLVSLRDSISGSNKASGKASQAISTQLIVGLNQANPLAHQQIYNQQAIYGGDGGPLQAQYNSTANSMSLTSNNSSLHQHQQHQLHQHQAMAGGGDYSLATSGDYATPDLQPIIQRPASNFAASAAAASSQLDAAFSRGSTRNIQPVQRQQAQQQLLMEHNYEQITSAELDPMRHQASHQRTLSSSQQGAAICQQQQQAFSSMTLSRARQQAPESSHYYYADTAAAKGCLAGAK